MPSQIIVVEVDGIPDRGESRKTGQDKKALHDRETHAWPLGAPVPPRGPAVEGASFLRPRIDHSDGRSRGKRTFGDFTDGFDLVIW